MACEARARLPAGPPPQEGGLHDLKPADVSSLAGRYGVDSDNLEQQLASIYSRFLRALLSDEDSAKPARVSQLGSLRRGLGLKWDATSALHTTEAEQLLDGEAPPPASSMPAELVALIWLSTSLFATSQKGADTAELRKTLGLSDAQAQALVSRVSAPIYKSAVAQAVGKYNITQTPHVLQKASARACRPPPPCRSTPPPGAA